MAAATPHRTLGRILLALSFAVSLLLLAGCGSSDDSGDEARTVPANDSPGAQEAVDRYRGYLVTQTGLLVDRTKTFVKALNYGNVEEAKRLYPSTREPYEAVEPVAESFGGLDPDIDARETDVPPASFRGFHRIEKALWVENTTKGVRSVAAKLLADVKRLQALVFTVKLAPAQVANGANELLNEVSSTKITGEEERYSHTDLWDIEANVQGSKAAYDSVKPLLEQQDPQLAKEIDQRFAQVEDTLRPYRRGDGFVLYGELSEQDQRQLAQSIDALAEPISQVAAIVAR
jgi:iron uptake system component EfeO